MICTVIRYLLALVLIHPLPLILPRLEQIRMICQHLIDTPKTKARTFVFVKCTCMLEHASISYVPALTDLRGELIATLAHIVLAGAHAVGCIAA